MGVERVVRISASKSVSKSVSKKRLRPHMRPKLDRTQTRFSGLNPKEIRNRDMCIQFLKHSGISSIIKPDTVQALRPIMRMCAKLINGETKILRKMVLEELANSSKDLSLRFKAKLEDITYMWVTRAHSNDKICCLETNCASRSVYVLKLLEDGKESLLVETTNEHKSFMEDGESVLVCAISEATISVLHWYFDCCKLNSKPN